ncbi:hypothetical protein F511_19476 [Dorcoceras hygrometricum]|uniref:Uncharacterized protein n=1 Tax=Dorcoceras hygrometricum TaxID=472368 RepID=A0A2Z7D5A6_9LAMI|nr:hypothetical protein F511_19476 [Dorcoceras hygrometricum]
MNTKLALILLTINTSAQVSAVAHKSCELKQRAVADQIRQELRAETVLYKQGAVFSKDEDQYGSVDQLRAVQLKEERTEA